MDKASPPLISACVSGTHLKNAILVVGKAGNQPVEFFEITLTDILVSSVAVDAGAVEGVLQEVVTPAPWMPR